MRTSTEDNRQFHCNFSVYLLVGHLEEVLGSPDSPARKALKLSAETKAAYRVKSEMIVYRHLSRKSIVKLKTGNEDAEARDVREPGRAHA